MENFPGVLIRHRKLAVRVKHPAKGWIYVATEYRPGQEAEAAALRPLIQAKLDEGSTVDAARGERTVAGFVPRWLKNYRERGGVKSWLDDKSRLEHHIIPKLGHLRWDEVEPRHVNEVMQAVKLLKRAPATVWNVYSVMQALFRDAQIEGLRRRDTPCILTERQLGKKRDAKKEWRSSAIFTREELTALVSDSRIPQDRRVMYALQGLGMLRHGEAAGLRWRHYLRGLSPLGRLVIATSYDTADTKTSIERWMPVHPLLAKVLAEWRLTGWRREFGRAPESDDLVLPVTRATNKGPRRAFMAIRDENYSWKRLHKDLAVLGYRLRRQHDLRRTGITLAREDGAERDILRLCTHAPPRDVMELYTSFGWAKLCAQISCLHVAGSKAVKRSQR